MRAITLFLLTLSLNAFALQSTLTYGPTKVVLVGKMELQTFPGPPNYESIQNGDETETHFYLKLDAPLNVVPTGKHPGVQDVAIERNIKIIQLSIPEEGAIHDKIRKIGKDTRVQIGGTLFHRFTGHHHSRVLLLVEDATTNP